MSQARRTEVVVLYDGVDISADISKHLIRLTYTDNASDKADDLQITLEDRDELWQGPWFPAKGAKLQVTITSAVDSLNFPLGSFEIDEITSSGKPSAVTIKAVSVGISSSIRREKKNKAWEGATLESIATEIAGGASMSLFYEADAVSYQRVDQRQESDLAFLRRLCREAGLSIKVAQEKLVIFDEEQYEQRAPVATIRKSDWRVTSYSFTTKAQDVYRACRVCYHDPKTSEQLEYEFVPPEAPPVGHTLEIKKRVESLDEARRVARKELRAKNRDEVTGQIGQVGNPSLSGGLNVDVSGFGVFDGRNHIKTATHSVDGGGGYTTSVSLRRVLGY